MLSVNQGIRLQPNLLVPDAPPEEGLHATGDTTPVWCDDVVLLTYQTFLYSLDLVRITTQQGILSEGVECLQASAKMLEATTPCFFVCSFIQCALPALRLHDKHSDVMNALQDMLKNCARGLPLSAEPWSRGDH